MKFDKIFENTFQDWDELEAKIEELPTTKEKGDAFEQFAYAYFVFFKDKYQIKEHFMWQDIPEKYREICHLEKKDSGVDGLIVKEDGSTVAYQVKFRSNQESPSYDDLTSFWAESEHADERCIFANCYTLPKQSYKKKAQFEVLRDRFSCLEPSFFKWLRDFAATGKAETKGTKYSPRDYQETIINDVIGGFDNNKRGKLIAACGTGKTLTALWIKQKLGSNLTLFIAPNLALVKQTLDSWISQESFSYICVCSDETVADENVEDAYTTDVDYLDVPVTTDPNQIKKFLDYDTSKNKVIFSTYQSLDMVSNAVKSISNRSIEFDIAFFDEAHRTAGNKNSEMFTYGMSDDRIPCKRRLFMTATERLVSPRIQKFAKQNDLEVFSMDNIEEYGPTFHSLTFRQAIEKGIISDYKIAVTCIKESELKELIDNNRIVKLDGVEDSAENVFKRTILIKAIKELGIRKVITYHKNIKAAKHFIFGANNDDIVNSLASSLPEYDSNLMYSNHINGTMPAGDRKKIFDDFTKAEFGIISNARCLTEGVDVPIIDAVYFADPKNSLIDIIQAVGRSLRKTSDASNQYSYILIPIIIPDEVTDFSEIDPDVFSTLHSVLQALRDQDNVLSDCIDQLNLNISKGKYGKGRSNPEIPMLQITVPKNLDTDDFINGLELRIAEVNKNPTDVKQSFTVSTVRKSGIKRTFRTIGDYTIESYYKNATLPTLKKFTSPEALMHKDDILIDHNNISHSVKIGAITKNDSGNFKMTEVGKELLKDDCDFIKIFKQQMIRYCDFGDKEKIARYPYRMAFRILKELKHLTRFEFLLSLYIAQRFDETGEKELVERVKELRQNYPNIEIQNETNKRVTVDELNATYGTSLRFEDIWTSRTTAANQFGYFSNHLSQWTDIFDCTQKNIIKIKAGAEAKIDSALEATKEIENCKTEDTYTDKYTKLS